MNPYKTMYFIDVPGFTFILDLDSLPISDVDTVGTLFVKSAHAAEVGKKGVLCTFLIEKPWDAYCRLTQNYFQK